MTRILQHSKHCIFFFLSKKIYSSVNVEAINPPLPAITACT
uniref:Uncharacterized protein n=1 Tax=Amphimedon queenslandica TaxID=400682 RepID=A0A1X7SWD9_AMPQE